MANKIKTLISQTALYGISSIVARFLNYLLTPLYTSIFKEQGNGEIASIYALITFCNILFTFGLETYFLKSVSTQNKKQSFQQSFTILILVNIFLGLLFFNNINNIANTFSLQNNKLIVYGIIIIILDALCTLPFANLRNDNKVKKYVFIKTFNIVINIAFNLYFLVLCPYLKTHYDNSLFLVFYTNNESIEYVFIANLMSSLVVFFCFIPTLIQWRWNFKWTVAKNIFQYSFPLIFVGLSGMVNDTIDRIMLPKLLEGDNAYRFSENGIYAANYKLSIVIILFIQAFKMGAEPFFFKNAKHKDAPELYAKVMKYFVIICCLGFLSVMLFLNTWQYFISAHKNKGFAEGLKVVPILLCANIFLGIYYNVSIWYKIKNKTIQGACIAIIGALITIVGNYYLIPQYSYLACAWTTCICYLSMLCIAIYWGRFHLPIPYPLARSSFYLIFAIGLGMAHYKYCFSLSFLTATAIGLLLFLLFVSVVLLIEHREIKTLFK